MPAALHIVSLLLAEEDADDFLQDYMHTWSVQVRPGRRVAGYYSQFMLGLQPMGQAIWYEHLNDAKAMLPYFNWLQPRLPYNPEKYRDIYDWIAEASKLNLDDAYELEFWGDKT